LPTLTIQDVGTINQSGEDTLLFDPHYDALSLKMVVVASDDLLITGVQEEMQSVAVGFQAIFQIIDALTNDVILNEVWESPFLWGRSFWISMGNNWARHRTTTQRLNAGVFPPIRVAAEASVFVG